MPGAIDFYFDFSSPFSYFAAMRIEELAARHGRKVNWHPVLLGVVFKTTGGRALTAIPIKGEYSLRDFERTARFHGIAYRHPAVFPVPTQAAARAMLWMRDRLGEDEAADFAKAVYQAYFVDGVDISDPGNVARIAQQFGIDPASLAEGLNSPELKARLNDLIERAMARGMFGAPFMIADGEPFWGFDRFGQLEAFLENGRI
jgi:2-hydroxychromene-2-carboxylate isomerase